MITLRMLVSVNSENVGESYLCRVHSQDFSLLGQKTFLFPQMSIRQSPQADTVLFMQFLTRKELTWLKIKKKVFEQQNFQRLQVCVFFVFLNPY